MHKVYLYKQSSLLLAKLEMPACRRRGVLCFSVMSNGCETSQVNLIHIKIAICGKTATLRVGDAYIFAMCLKQAPYAIFPYL